MRTPTRMALLGVWLGAAVVHAQTETAPTAAPESGSSTSSTTTTTATAAAPGAPAAPAGPQVQAEIVSVDAAAKTITVRESTGGDATDAAGKTPAAATLPVEGNAIARLAVVKAGNRVTLICAAPDASASAGKTSATATATETTSSATSSTDTTSAPASGSTSTAQTASADTSSRSPLNATCSSVVEIAKARATTTAPQQ
jgi:hypothetical protein